ncbi:MAG TPA: cell division topological specificity factor MinE [Nevskiales bacterium]|nr:cell division topological specificity factor MinE [Nevskiales bacterium]
MNWLNLFRTRQAKSSAALAKERLIVVVANQRSQAGGAEFMPRLRAELLTVIRKYVKVNDDAIRMAIERDGDMEVLELNIVLPEPGAAQH